MSGPGDMYRLLLEREQAFQDKTQDVFAHTEFLCEAILQHLGVEPKDTNWISIDMIGVEIIVMVSIPDTDPQRYAATGQEPVQILTIVIPCSVVDVGETELIVSYLEETYDIRQSDNESTNEDVEGIIAAQTATRRILH